jgi:endonuclease YncB( thermonuclease family)
MPFGLAVLAVVAAWLASAYADPLAGASVARAQEDRLIGQVVAVVDGGTLRVRLDAGTVETVRLRGLHVPASASSTAPPECFGSQAAGRLAVLAPVGSSVELQIGVPERDEDGRLLAFVWRDDAMLMVNEQLLAEGFARVPQTPPASEYDEQFACAQATAQAHHLGRWAACGEESGVRRGPGKQITDS